MILDSIIERKREELAALRRVRPLEAVRAEAAAAARARDFRAALAGRPDVALVAEIKRRSPSAGLIRADLDAASVARAYAEGGAAALSVLTDETFFGGRLEFIAQARSAAALPALRKDFVIDEYQVYEARAAGADAVLLIVRVLSDAQLGGFLAAAGGLGMGALVEVHSVVEAERAERAGADLVGINNRDLDTLAVDLDTTRVVAREAPSGCMLVSESGISSRRDVELLAASGVQAVLVGEHLMRSRDIAGAARELTGVPRVARVGRG